jgi:subfamily B ATP-binding cassette protein MsbA
MDRNDNKAGSKIILLFRMMLRYWPYMVAGLVAMGLFALFSGFSITLMVPLFDYVFNPNKPEIQYHNSSEIIDAIQQRLATFTGEHGSLLRINSLADLTPLWDSLKELMLVSDSLSLLYLLCMVIVVLILLKNICYFANRSFFVMLRGKTIRDLRNYMFRRYLNQSLEFYCKNQVGDAIVRMVNDVEIVSNQFIFALFNSIRDFSTVIVYMYIALFLNRAYLPIVSWWCPSSLFPWVFWAKRSRRIPAGFRPRFPPCSVWWRKC